MNSNIVIPSSLKAAGRELRRAMNAELEKLPKRDFLRVWSSIAYAYPGLHPDGYEDEDSGWPRVLKRFAADAWRRADAGELNDEELYPCDAQWSGLYDRMNFHTEHEISRRSQIEENFGLMCDA